MPLSFFDLVSKFKKSIYLKNVLTLASGTTFAQLVTVIIAPILYRIYDKVDYGTLGVYAAIVGVASTFSTLQYLQPILLEKDDDDAKKVVWMNTCLNFSWTLLFYLAIYFFGEHLATLLNNKEITPWLYLAPLSTFCSAQREVLSIWANRKKQYKILSFNAILTAIIVPFVSITVGLLHKGPLGLFLGLITSQIIPPIVLYLKLSKRENLGFQYLDFKVIKEKIVEHKHYPIYHLPSDFINRVINQMPVFMLSTFCGPAVVGMYNLSVKILGLPIQLIGGAIGKVFQQKATEDFLKTGGFVIIFKKTLKILLFIAGPCFLFFIMFGPVFFSFVFGNEWHESGVYAQILILLFVSKLVVSPLTYSYFIRHQLKQNFFLHVYMLVSTLVIFLIGFRIFNDEKIVLLFYMINYVFVYIYYLYQSYKLSHPISR